MMSIMSNLRRIVFSPKLSGHAYMIESKKPRTSAQNRKNERVRISNRGSETTKAI